MRIVCPTVPDFLENLNAAHGLFQNTIWCSIIRRPEDGQRDAVKFEVVIQMSAVVVYGEGEEALVEVGVSCGYDYEDANGSYEGSGLAADLKQQVLQACESQGWRVLPGIIDQ